MDIEFLKMTSVEFLLILYSYIKELVDKHYTASDWFLGL